MVADSLGMKTVIVHPLSGILSAYGMGLADIRATRQQAVVKTLNTDNLSALEELAQRLATDAKTEVENQGVAEDELTVIPRAHLRYDGTDTPIAVDLNTGDLDAMIASFTQNHIKQFGFAYENKTIVVEALEVEAVGGGAGLLEPDEALASQAPAIAEQTQFYANGKWQDASILKRDAFQPGMKLQGPALIMEPHATIVVEPGWLAEVNAKNHIILTRSIPLEKKVALGTTADPVMLEVFNNLFMSIAEQMGVTLQNTAYSVNIKERLDFSCAVFDQNGALVAKLRTCQFIWGPWTVLLRRSFPSTKARSDRAMCSHLTPLTMAAPTCPTSPLSLRSLMRTTKKSCSGLPPVVTMQTWAVPLRAP